MANPLISLTIGVMILLAGWLLFRPNRGYFWQWRQAFRNTERVLIEDALKHLYDCEYKNIPCTLQSISGALSVSGDRVAELLERLEMLGLVVSQGQLLELTDDGRSYALRIIRVHRLWERYLADKTGLSEMDWHAEAEKIEHRMTAQEANALAAKMGNPRFDPHGDPIPTASGDIPPPRGIPLTDLPDSEFAEIIHIEDEPAAIYAQLVAQGLHPGMQVQMLDVAPERIQIAADGNEVFLAPIFAANVTVQPLPEEQTVEVSGEPLSNLTPGEDATVVAISRACRGLQRRRLMDLGILPGAKVSSEMRSASGDPTAYKIRGATIALRKIQSDLIYVQKD